jgi:hypothetical protein
MTQPESLLSVGGIARRLGQEVHRIEYVIRSRDDERSFHVGGLSRTD